jgi:hypothetical protein
VLALTALSGCDSRPAQSSAHQETATPQPAGSLCDLIRPTLTGDWKSEQRPPANNPISDVCRLTDTADPDNQYRISVAVLPVSAQDVATMRKDEERQLKGQYVVQPVDGGIGQDSWSVNPAAVGPWVVFRSHGRLVRVAQNASGPGRLESVKAVARTIDSLSAGISAAPAIRRRPECDRGTKAAEALLGATAAARYDTVTDGFTTCRWGSPRGAVFVAAGGLGSDPGVAYMYAKDAAAKSWTGVHKVGVGDEGWQQADGFIAYRVGQDVFVNVAAMPSSAEKSPKVLDLARVIRSAYGR